MDVDNLNTTEKTLTRIIMPMYFIKPLLGTNRYADMPYTAANSLRLNVIKSGGIDSGKIANRLGVGIE